MSDDPCSIGINHAAFSVSKKALLDWVNAFFELDYQKVEECATGAIHCQIADAIFPGKVKMSTVNWEAKTEYDFEKNFKILDSVFLNQGVQKPVPIRKLIRAKYQDNLEWLQWMKHFFQCKYTGQPYNPVQRRMLSTKPGKKGTIKSKPKTSSSATSAAKKTTTKTTTKTGTTSKTGTKMGGTKTGASSGASSAQMKALNEKVSELKMTVEGLERERDFYFGKLREVEVLCQQKTETEGEDATIACSEILGILYKTDEEEGGDGAAPAEEAAEDEEETY